MKIFVFCTGTWFTHVTACFIQGVVKGGLAHVSSNLETRSVDSRSVSTPDLASCEVNLSPHLNDEDVLVVDESRALGGMFSDPNVVSFYENLRIVAKQKPVVVLYMQDDANIVCFPEGLIVLASHRNKFASFVREPLPLPFSLSLDVIGRAEAALSHNRLRNRVAIRNFRPSYNQAVRDVLDLAMVPLLSQIVEVDDRLLFDDAYAEQLSLSQMVLAYGGTLYPNFSTNPVLQSTEFASFEGRVAVFRWDSWRFWESLVFGCATVQLDCGKYGLQLPHEPIPWEHYIPLDFSDIPGMVRRIADGLNTDNHFLTRIGEQGRRWVLENYHPTKRAQEILAAAGVAL